MERETPVSDADALRIAEEQYRQIVESPLERLWPPTRYAPREVWVTNRTRELIAYGATETEIALLEKL